MAKKILIVDDSKFTRDIHRGIVGNAGFEAICEAGTGAEAVKVFQAEKPDIVLLDLLMPDMDGFDAAKAILEIDPAARIIICSTDKQKHRRNEAKEIGVKDFIAKPVDPEELAAVLRDLK